MSFLVNEPLGYTYVDIWVQGNETPNSLWEYDTNINGDGYAYEREQAGYPPGLLLLDQTFPAAPANHLSLEHVVAPSEEGYIHLFFNSIAGAGNVVLTGSAIDDSGNTQTTETITISSIDTEYVSQYRWASIDSSGIEGPEGMSLEIYQKRLGVIFKLIDESDPSWTIFQCPKHMGTLYISGGAQFIPQPDTAFYMTSDVAYRGIVKVRPDGIFQAGLLGAEPTYGYNGCHLKMRALLCDTPSGNSVGTINLYNCSCKARVDVHAGNIFDCKFGHAPTHVGGHDDNYMLYLGRHAESYTNQNINAKRLVFEGYGVGQYGALGWAAENPNLSIDDITILMGYALQDEYSEPDNQINKELDGLILRSDMARFGVYFDTTSRRHFILRNVQGLPSLRISQAKTTGTGGGDDVDWHPLMFFKDRLDLTVVRGEPSINANNWTQNGYAKTVTHQSLVGATVKLYDSNGNSVFRESNPTIYWTGTYIDASQLTITLSAQISSGYYWIDEELIYVESCTGSPPYIATIQRERQGTTAGWHTTQVTANRYLRSEVASLSTESDGKVPGDTIDLCHLFIDWGRKYSTNGTLYAVADANHPTSFTVDYNPFTLVILLDGYTPHFQQLQITEDTTLVVPLQPLTPYFDGANG